MKNSVVYSGEDASRVYDRRLGMDRPITRRDFLNGVRIAAAGSRVGSSGLLKAFGAQAGQAASAYYPPMLTGMRGSHGGSWEAAHELRDGRAWDNPSEVDDPYDLSVDLQRFYSAFDPDLYESLDLTDGVFFDKETFGVDRLVPGYQRLPWAEFAARTPISDSEQKDLVRLHEEGKDYLPGLSSIEKKLGSARLATATI